MESSGERADSRYVVVTESWNYRGLTYFAATHSISITVFGIVAGVIMWGTKRFKVCPPPSNQTPPKADK
jgi:hypothetical protein